MLSVRVTSSSDVDCYGESTGSAEVEVSGGTPDDSGEYSYSWTLASMPVPIRHPSCSVGHPLEDEMMCLFCTSNPTEPICRVAKRESMPFGKREKLLPVMPGSVVVSTNYTASGLKQGVYYIAVTDSNNCPANTVVTIDEPSMLIVLLIKKLCINEELLQLKWFYPLEQLQTLNVMVDLMDQPLCS